MERLGADPMKKVCEIDAAEVYNQIGIGVFDLTRSKRRYRVNPEWFDRYFTTAQKQILEQHGYTLRPHPRHNPTIELFVDEQQLTDRDWTLIRILF